MKDGKCPKCQSHEVYMSEGRAGAYGIGTMPISTFAVAVIAHYVCVACGYVEQYILDDEKLHKITEKWSKVQ